MAQGPRETTEVVRKILTEGAVQREAMADRAGVGGGKAGEKLRREARAMRRLARVGSGPEVQELTEERQRAATEAADRMREEGASRAQLEEWCASTVARGVATFVGANIFRTDGFAAPGMSGGPVLDRRGLVVGVIVRQKEAGPMHQGKNTVAVRADRIVAELGPIPKDTFP
jgi:Trypsin-like peptidase domain